MIKRKLHDAYSNRNCGREVAASPAIRWLWSSFIYHYSRIQTTLDLSTQQDNDEARAAQEFLRALGISSQLIH